MRIQSTKTLQKVVQNMAPDFKLNYSFNMENEIVTLTSQDNELKIVMKLIRMPNWTRHIKIIWCVGSEEIEKARASGAEVLCWEHRLRVFLEQTTHRYETKYKNQEAA